jgi:hypothetical protein
MAETAKNDIKMLFDTEPCEDHAFTGLLIGPTGSGKSAVVRRFCKDQADRDKAAGFTGRSVVYVRLPDRCKTKDLFQALLTELGDAMATRRDSYIDMQETAVKLLRRYKTRMVIFDETQHAVPRKGVRLDAYAVANFFKALQDDAGTNILFCGLESARQLMQNAQLESRGLIEARMSAFDWWLPEQQEAFRNILFDFQRMMEIPYKKLDPEDDTKLVADDLSEEDVAWRLSFGSRGLLRVVVKFLILLQQVAASEKRTYVDRGMFERVWDKLPVAVRGGPDNPFKRDSMPNFRWKAAGHAEGDRVGS